LDQEASVSSRPFRLDGRKTPNGIQDSIEEIVQDNLVLDHNIIEYIHDNNTCDNELDEWLQMINDYQTTGRIV